MGGYIATDLVIGGGSAKGSGTGSGRRQAARKRIDGALRRGIHRHLFGGDITVTRHFSLDQGVTQRNRCGTQQGHAPATGNAGTACKTNSLARVDRTDIHITSAGGHVRIQNLGDIATLQISEPYRKAGSGIPAAQGKRTRQAKNGLTGQSSVIHNAQIRVNLTKHIAVKIGLTVQATGLQL